MTDDFDAVKLRPLWKLQDVLRDILDGVTDLEGHSYITCSDLNADNAERGCPRCVVLQFVRSPS